jgi:hypothetical protein
VLDLSGRTTSTATSNVGANAVDIDGSTYYLSNNGPDQSWKVALSSGDFSGSQKITPKSHLKLLPLHGQVLKLKSFMVALRQS